MTCWALATSPYWAPNVFTMIALLLQLVTINYNNLS